MINQYQIMKLTNIPPAFDTGKLKRDCEQAINLKI